MNTQATTNKPSGQAGGSQMRITPDEMALIKSMFANNEAGLKLLRKMFLPELDPTAPIGQMIDIYRTISVKDRDPMMVAIDLQARNFVIDHVENALMQLLLLSKMEAQTPEEARAKLKADGNK